MPATIRLTASDTLFFGSGRPFTMGEDSWTISVFPPHPETIYGFLRACYFLDQGADYIHAGDPIHDPTLKLKVDNYGLIIDTAGASTRLFPMPLDLVFNKDSGKIEQLSLTPQNDKIICNGTHNLPFKLIYSGIDKVRKADDVYYLTEEDMKMYMQGKARNVNPLRLKDHISIETKIGIKRDRHQSENKQLYRIQLNRLQTEHSELSLWVTYDSLAFTTCINRLGGEGKLVFISQLDNPTLEENNTGFNEGDIVRMYLSTHAIFPDGWKPDVEGTELLAAVIGDPLFIGGFDIQDRKPKPTMKVVPAGSVYYFRITENFTKTLKVGMLKDKGYGYVYFNKI